MNESLKDYLNAVENDIDALTDPSKFSSREDMGEMFHDFLGYDPTRYWDQQIMMEQMTKLTETDDVVLSLDEREDAVEAALDHFDAIKPNIMLQVAQEQAEKNGFEQMELGVFADNPRPIHVYEKSGFHKVGVQPHAFKLKDGSYVDEIEMVKFF